VFQAFLTRREEVLEKRSKMSRDMIYSKSTDLVLLPSLFSSHLVN
jgi:hypothetical protein